MDWKLTFILQLVLQHGLGIRLQTVREVMTASQGFNFHLVTDFNDHSHLDFIQDFMDHGYGLESTDVRKETKLAFPVHQCDVHQLEETEYIPHAIKPTFFLVATAPERINMTAELLVKTVVNCPTKVELKALERSNIIAVMTNNNDFDSAVANVLDQAMLKKHENLVFIQEGPDFVEFHRYNIFSDKMVSAAKVSVDSPWPDLTQEVFEPLPMDGYTYKVGTLPYAYFVLADYNQDSVDPKKMYTNHSGYDLQMLQAAADVLNFDYEIFNPEDQQWGQLERNESGIRWNGVMGGVATGEFDSILGMIYSDARLRVSAPSPLTDHAMLTWAAPNPKPYFNFMTFAHPLRFTVWILLFAAIAVTVLALNMIARVEERAIGDDLRFWSSPGLAVWYVYGTFLGESITKERNGSSQNSQLSLRVAMATWILGCLVISAAYGGNLKAFLTTPSYEKPIDTLDDIIHSGLEWDMVIYGEEIETYMAASTDPVITAIWTGKKEAEYSAVATERLKRVVNGELVSIEYGVVLEMGTFLRFSTPEGDPLVHISKNPVSTGPISWLLYKKMVGLERINKVILNMIEAGLIDKWKRITLIEIKEKDQIRKYEVEEPPAIRSMSLSDLYGVFMAWGCLMSGTILVALLEKCI